MRRTLEIPLAPQQAFGDYDLKQTFAKALRVEENDIRGIRIIKRSIDSRSRNIWIRVLAEVFINEEYQAGLIRREYKTVSDKHRVVIVGAGPAGLFAALKLIESGIKPIILERGRDIHSRKKDIATLNRESIVNPDSNYCFGEGGAGTFSDGKLYTRSTKRGNVPGILETLIWHGADKEILYDNHPHIGSDKLPAIIEKIRESIISSGGEIHFGSRITGFIIEQGEIRGVVDQENSQFTGEATILATGHSARDIYELLFQKEILITFKPFALGVRIEHPQELIDSIQYHCKGRPKYLPAATYSLVAQAAGRGVFSFCMCPGGIIVPAASKNGQVVVNGMSNSRRNSAFANSGIVAGIEEKDLENYSIHGAMKGLKFQEDYENKAFLAGGSCQKAPAQRLTDFLGDKISQSLPESSYHPGLVSTPLHQLLPSFVSNSLKEAFGIFEKRMKGFITRDAVITGVESRTSSPVRISRNEKTLEHLQVKNLYPCGEGSGYSGGIVSSAIDGERVAEQIALKIIS